MNIMKKTLAVSLGALIILGSIGTATLFAAETERQVPQQSAESGIDGGFGMGRGRGGAPFTMGEPDEEQLAQMEEAIAEREASLTAFVEGLTAEQKALYDAMMPVMPADGEEFVKPDETAMQEMRANREAFLASLSDEQKETFESLHFGHGGFGKGREMSEERQAQMDERRAEYEEKYNAFVGTLDESQKAAFEELEELSGRGQRPNTETSGSDEV
jgi:hypothetical protein